MIIVFSSMSNIHLANTLLCWNHRWAWKNHFCSWSFDSDFALQNHSVIKAWKRLRWVGGGGGEREKGKKKNLKTIKHKPRLYLERSGCCIPIPDDLWDATEVPLKRERMREQLFSVTAHTAYHDFPSGRLGQDYHNLPPAPPVAW